MGIIGSLEWMDDGFEWEGLTWQRSYTRVYRAFFPTTDDAFAVRTGIGLVPLMTHPEDSGARITKISGKLENKNQVTGRDGLTPCFPWIITIEYGYVNPLLITEDGNPLNMPMRFRFEPSEEEEIVTEDVHPDADGNDVPITNTAGQPFDPPVTRPRGKGVLTVIRNEAADFDWVGAYDYWYYRTNEAPFLGFPENTFLSIPFRVPEIAYSQEADVYYYPMEYTFMYDPNGWHKAVLNAGVDQVNPSDDTKLIPILVGGQPATQPQLLDDDGYALTLPVNQDDVIYLDFDVFESRDYTWFNMDNLFDTLLF